MTQAPVALFVCTGNYYRSRFAEHLFAHLVAKQGLSWATDSAGLGVDWAWKTNPGPISSVAVASLAQRGIPVTDPRMPRSLTADDLEASARVVLLDEPEHRPMMQQQFPGWEDHERVTYWEVIDVPPSEAFHPMDAIDPLVRGLVAELASA